MQVFNPLEINRYGYAANNPVHLADPSGHGFVDTGALYLSAIEQSAVAAGMIGLTFLYTLTRVPDVVGVPEWTWPNFPDFSPDGPDPNKKPEPPRLSDIYKAIFGLIVVSLLGNAISGGIQPIVEGEPQPVQPPEPEPMPETEASFFRTIDRARTNPRNYTIRSGRIERGLSTFSDRLDPQYVLQSLGRLRLIVIPSSDPVIPSLGLTWIPSAGKSGDPMLDANHWELSLVSGLADGEFVAMWNQSIAPALAAEAIRWREIRRARYNTRDAHWASYRTKGESRTIETRSRVNES